MKNSPTQTSLSKGRIKTALTIAIITLLVMTLYEAAKEFFVPGFSKWESHLITITFSVMIAFLISVLLLKNREGLYAAILRESEERKKAEEKLEILAHSVLSASEYISITDLNDNVIFVNDAFRRAYGIEEQDFVGKPIAFVRSPKTDPAIFKEILPATLRGGWQGEIWNQRKDGTEFLIHLSTSIVRNDKGETIALIGLSTDITEQRRKEEQMLKLQLGVERSSDAIFITDKDGAIGYTNPAFETIYGFTKEDALGKTPRILKSGLSGPEMYELFWQQLLQKKSVAGEIVNKTKDGSIVTVEGSADPILNQHGEIIGFIGIQRDVTQRKQLEADREKLVAELQEALAEIKTLGGLIPICTSCKKIRDDKGYWNILEAYLTKHTDARFTHGICPECASKLYPDYLRK
jgi:PAS domain S-box-containing protein